MHGHHARRVHFVQGAEVPTDARAETLVRKRDEHVLAVAQGGFEERVEGGAPGGVGFAGGDGVGEAELGRGEGGDGAGVDA